MEEPRVLICCITNDSQAYALDRFIECVNAQDHKNFELLFIDNSPSLEYVERLKKSPSTVLHEMQSTSSIETTVNCRKKAREYFLAGDYQYLLFADIEIILPKNTISRLLFHHKDIISGVYLADIKIGEKTEVCPSIYDFAYEGFARIMELREILDDKLIEISCSGLGCTLISREVLETVSVRYFEQSMTGDNIAFFIDARSKGFEAFADTSIKCNRLVKADESGTARFSFDSYPKIRNPRVLIGCVTHDKAEGYIKGFLDAIRSQDYKNYDILFVETSSSEEYTAKLKGVGSIVLKGDSDAQSPIERITNGRNIIRDYMIKNNYDYLMFVDTDVILQPTALSKLMSNRKDVVAGICLSTFNVNGNHKVMPNVFILDKEVSKPLMLNEVLSGKLMEISHAGFGCALMTRNVLEKIGFRYFENQMAGEDIAFFTDAKQDGFGTFADTSVRCTHLIFPTGDPRNRKFMFDNYEKVTMTMRIDYR